jgi:hypothetical protein
LTFDQQDLVDSDAIERSCGAWCEHDTKTVELKRANVRINNDDLIECFIFFDLPDLFYAQNESGKSEAILPIIFLLLYVQNAHLCHALHALRLSLGIGLYHSICGLFYPYAFRIESLFHNMIYGEHKKRKGIVLRDIIPEGLLSF